MKKPIPFGKYLLLDRINVGGMAEVFKAKAFGVEGFERLVAVKRILPSIAEDTEFIEMFTDEAKIAVQLTHANIAQIFDLGKVADSYFIALEYVNGRDLRAIFDRARKRGEPLPVPMACFVVMKVCEGLDYAHNKKNTAGRELQVVHRDVSPQNVLISYDGEVKVIDFGIAKAAGKAGKTQAGILKGKFGYMSPEQVRGLPLDRRSDIFALGICLYELLTGERLFVGESDFSTLEKVRNVEIMPPSTYNRRIPEELEQIVLKALSKEVEDRYQTAMDLHDDLQSFMYTSGNFFARKDLGAYMRKAFGDEIAKESAKDEEYAKITSPSSGLEAFDNLPSAEAAHVSPAQTVPPPQKERKKTMMGMPAAGPPPPPPRVSRPPTPPPPAPPKVSAAPPPSAAQVAAAPTIDMDWDEEELSTQIYDKPEAMAAMASGGPPAGPSAPPRPPPPAPPPISGQAQIPIGGSLGPPPAPPPRVSSPPFPPTAPAFAAPPPAAGPAPTPYRPPGAPLPAPGAPSPFDPPYGAPSLGRPGPPTIRPEPTAVTPRPGGQTKKSSSLLPILAVAAVLLLGLASVGAYLVFFRSSPGTIQLTTVPADPIVLFDTHPVQATSSPFVISDVAPGDMHLLEVSRPGYQTWSQQVRLQSGQTLPVGPVMLVPAGAVVATGTGGTGVLPGTGTGGVTPPPLPPPPAGATGFALDTQPTGARIFVDEHEITQHTPAQVTDLAPGTHTIRVDAGNNYESWQTQISVVAGQMQTLPRAVLNLRSVAVDFRSTPDGASITLLRGSERRQIGVTPTHTDVDLTGGAWTVEISKDNYDTFTQALAFPPGQATYTLEATLNHSQVAVRPPGGHPHPHPPGGGHTNPPPGGGDNPSGGGGGGGMGTLRINTRPWSQVFVDGQLIGNTPQMNIPLRAGSHRVTLVNNDFNIRETVSVSITAGGTETRVLTLTPGG